MEIKDLNLLNWVKLFLGIGDNGTNYKNVIVIGLITDDGGLIKIDNSKNWQSLDNIEPIEINHNWLIDLGGEKIGLDYYFLRYNVHKPDNYDHYLFCEGDIVLRDIKYVHELQNLYKSLIGEDLKLIH